MARLYDINSMQSPPVLSSVTAAGRSDSSALVAGRSCVRGLSAAASPSAVLLIADAPAPDGGFAELRFGLSRDLRLSCRAGRGCRACMQLLLGCMYTLLWKLPLV